MVSNADRVSENVGVGVSPEKLINEIKPYLNQLAENNLPELIKLFDDVVAEAKKKKSLAANTTMPGTSPGNGSSVPNVSGGTASF